MGTKQEKQALSVALRALNYCRGLFTKPFITVRCTPLVVRTWFPVDGKQVAPRRRGLVLAAATAAEEEEDDDEEGLEGEKKRGRLTSRPAIEARPLGQSPRFSLKAVWSVCLTHAHARLCCHSCCHIT